MPVNLILDNLDLVTSKSMLFELAHNSLHKLDVTGFTYVFLPRDAIYYPHGIQIVQKGRFGAGETFMSRLKSYSQSRQGAALLKLISTSKHPSSPSSIEDRHSIKLLSINPEMEEEQALQVIAPLEAGNNDTGLFILQTRFKGTSKVSLRKYKALCSAVHERFCEIWEFPEARKIHLTSREKDVLFWAYQGKSSGVIGEILGLSRHTIDQYIRRLFMKFKVNDRVSLAIKAKELSVASQNINYAVKTF